MTTTTVDLAKIKSVLVPLRGQKMATFVFVDGPKLCTSETLARAAGFNPNQHNYLWNARKAVLLHEYGLEMEHLCMINNQCNGDVDRIIEALEAEYG